LTNIGASTRSPHHLFEIEVSQRHGPWRSFEGVEFATLQRVDWFNNHRLLEPIGNIPPTEAEDCHYAQTDGTPWRRDANQTASGKPGAVHVQTSRIGRGLSGQAYRIM
jgi:hypothetical protein